MMLYDMTGVCKFSRGLMFDEGLLELSNAVTGFDMSVSEFLTAGERVYNLSKAFNVREGFDRKDDTLPDRVFEDEVLYGPTEGEKLSRRKFQEELDRYYNIRGWDEEGIPMKRTLNELEMPDVAEEVGSTNRNY